VSLSYNCAPLQVVIHKTLTTTALRIEKDIVPAIFFVYPNLPKRSRKVAFVVSTLKNSSEIRY
jgi:hypothetical protein